MNQDAKQGASQGRLRRSRTSVRPFAEPSARPFAEPSVRPFAEPSARPFAEPSKDLSQNLPRTLF